jgi:septum site-determining protein MinC
MAVLELKGRMLSTTRVRARSQDFAAMSAQLARMAEQMPTAVRGMPVILESDAAIDLGAFIATVRDIGMQPIGVSGEHLAEAARSWGLAVLPLDSGQRGARASPPAAAEAPAAPVVAAAPAPRSTRLVSDPVRGGQQIYVPDGDLVITHQVGAGAKVAADGCIHIYGRLAGRAIAGAQGDTAARIFCRRFEPELVAIAGVYAVAEQLQGEAVGKPAQVWLDGGKLRVAVLSDSR